MNMLLLLSSFMAKTYVDALFFTQGIINWTLQIKYIISFAGIAVGIIQLFFVKDKVFKKEFTRLCVCIGTLIAMSLAISLFAGRISPEIGEDIFKLVFPVLYAYVILNLFSYEDIMFAMKAILWICVSSYILEIGITNFTPANFLSMNFATSYSPFESNNNSVLSFVLAAFFTYFPAGRLYKYSSIIFAIMTFKRVTVIFALFLLVVPIFVNIRATLKPIWRNLLIVSFVLVPVAYHFFLTGGGDELSQALFGQDIAVLVSGRNYFLDSLALAGYESFGLGSSTEIINRNLEMDLVKFYIELGIAGLAVFVYGYFTIAGNSLYSLFLMFFVFFKMLTSQFLTQNFPMIILFVIYGLMLYKEPAENTRPEECATIFKRRKRRRRRKISPLP